MTNLVNGAGLRLQAMVAAAFADPRALVRLTALHLAAMAALYLVTFTDMAELQAIWADPRTALPQHMQFLLFNPLPNLFGHLFAPPGAFGYYLVTLAWTALGVFGTLAVIFAAERGERRALYVLMFLGCFVLFCITQRIGKSDPLFVFFYVCAFFLRRNPWVSGLMLAATYLCHPSQGTFLIVVHAMLGAMEQPAARLRALIAPAIGFALGFALNQAYIAHFDLSFGIDRIEYAQIYAPIIFQSMLTNPVLSLYSAYGLMWVAVLARAAQADQRWFKLAALFPLAAAFGTEYSRVAMMVGLPLFFFTIEYFAAHRLEAAKGFIVRYAPVLVPASLIMFMTMTHGAVISSAWWFWLTHPKIAPLYQGLFGG
jgi:hypothetical protein